MKLNKILLTIAVSLLSNQAFCQEVLTPLKYNPLLAKSSNHSSVKATERSDSVNTAIKLPFLDDFSYSQKYPYKVKYPNPALWMDSDVYINDDYGFNPPTVGVATFDGLNKYGQPYNFAPFAQGWADSLTSRIINLRESSPGDSIYLSFFYQPQGNGDPPTSFDSLVLEFKDTTGKFDEVWSVGGDSLVTFERNFHQSFKQVLIPVKDLKYFHPGFQFRFRNYAEISGNNNDWNIDYVKMKPGRSDTVFTLNDVAFQYNSQGILKNYTQMPWNQFYNYQSTELRSNYSFTIRNNYSVPNNINFIDSLINLSNNSFIPLSQSSFSINIDSESAEVESFPTFQIPTNIGYTDGHGNDVAEISVRTNIAALTSDGNQSNDTIYHDQFFDNYFAYDDGTAETAYSLIGNGASPELAVQFNLNQPDSLRAIQVFFPYANATENTSLMVPQVWSSLVPENVSYTDTFLRNLIFVDSLNGFTTYVLRHPRFESGTIYVGFEEVAQDTMYVGYDVNDNDSTKLFYNVGSGFTQTQFHGIVMIRPVFGKPIGYSTGIAPAPASVSGSLVLYPNPVNDILKVEIQNTLISDNNVCIQNILGQTVITQSSSTGKSYFEVNVKNLPAGIYFIHLTDDNNNNTLSAKFVKTN